VDNIFEVHVNSPSYKDGKWYDINKPFYQLEDAEEVVRHIIDEKISKKGELLLNLECEEEAEKQIALLRSHANQTQR